MPRSDPPLPPPSPSPARSHSRLRRTLHTLRSPFRSGSPFHIGSIKRAGSKSTVSDDEIARDERTMRKRNKKHRESASDASPSTDGSPGVDKKKKDGSSLLRRMGSIGKRRAEESTPPSSLPGTPDATIEIPSTPPPDKQPEKEPGNVLEKSTSENVIEKSSEKEPVKVAEKGTEKESATPDAPVSPIAVEHPVATRPFTKAAWKRKSEPEMEKPVEEPSPENALRRRIAFVAQASACLSEDHDDGERGESEVGSLEEAVALARVRLAPAPPSPSHSRDNDTEEEGYADAMPAYGDLIEPDSKPGNSEAPVSVAWARARRARSQWPKALRAMRARHDLRGNG